MGAVFLGGGTLLAAITPESRIQSLSSGADTLTEGWADSRNHRRRWAITFILDMASGTEHLGGELSCGSKTVEKAPSHAPAIDERLPQLQLAMVEATEPYETRSAALAGLDLKTLIRSIED